MTGPGSDIAEAMIGNLDADLAVNREVLKYAVMRQIFCPRSGMVLDIRRAVLFTVALPDVDGVKGKSASECVDGAKFDEIRPALEAACAAKGVSLEIIDGRVVNARKPRASKARA
jgi:hypothetical protein